MWQAPPRSAVWFVMLVGVAAGCARPLVPMSLARLGEHGPTGEALLARRSRLRAEMARPSGPRLVRSVQLRVRDLRADGFAQTRARARVRLNSPFVEAELVGAREHERAGRVASADAGTLREAAERCDLAVEAARDGWRQVLDQRRRGPLRRMRAWVEAWERAGTLHPLRARRLALRLRRATVAAAGRARPIGSLPSLPSLRRPGGIDMSDARIEAAVAEHPSVRARASQGERMRRMASAEVLRAVPFVEFLEVGTELVDPRPGAVEFGVAVTVPVEPWSHSRAEEYRLRAAAVAEEGQTQAARLVARAFRARERLRSFEAGRADWRELAALADVSERRMLALVEARSGDPGDVLQILEEVHQSRREVLAARVAAAAARCELMRTTGRSFEDWSRGR